MTFGYDSKVVKLGGVNQLGIDGHAKALLNELAAIRRTTKLRPLIFIVHSLGGIVLKEAFRYTTGAGKIHKDLVSVATSTHGIIFFGTPHRGGNGTYVFLGKVARNWASLLGFGTNKKNLTNLEMESSTLDQLNEEFIAWCEEHPNVRVSSIQETKGLSGWGFTGQVRNVPSHVRVIFCIHSYDGAKLTDLPSRSFWDILQKLVSLESAYMRLMAITWRSAGLARRMNRDIESSGEFWKGIWR